MKLLKKTNLLKKIKEKKYFFRFQVLKFEIPFWGVTKKSKNKNVISPIFLSN